LPTIAFSYIVDIPGSPDNKVSLFLLYPPLCAKDSRKAGEKNDSISPWREKSGSVPTFIIQGPNLRKFFGIQAKYFNQCATTQTLPKDANGEFLTWPTSFMDLVMEEQRKLAETEWASTLLHEVASMIQTEQINVDKKMVFLLERAFVHLLGVRQYLETRETEQQRASPEEGAGLLGGVWAKWWYGLWHVNFCLRIIHGAHKEAAGRLMSSVPELSAAMSPVNITFVCVSCAEQCTLEFSGCITCGGENHYSCTPGGRVLEERMFGVDEAASSRGGASAATGSGGSAAESTSRRRRAQVHVDDPRDAILTALKERVLLNTVARNATKMLSPNPTLNEQRIIKESEVKEVLVSIFQKQASERDARETEIWQIRNGLGDSLSLISSWDDDAFSVAVYNAGVVLGNLVVIKVDSRSDLPTTRSKLRSAGGAHGRFAFAVYFPNGTATALLSCTKGVQAARARGLYSHLQYSVEGTELCGFSLKKPHEQLPFGCVKLVYETTGELPYLRSMLREVVSEAERKAQGGVGIAAGQQDSIDESTGTSSSL